MRRLLPVSIDWGDAPAWVALVVAVVAAFFAWRSVREAKRSADAGEASAKEAKRSADAGEVSAQAAVRSADAAEKAHQLAEKQYRDSLPPPVDWVVERTSKSKFLLRNIGTHEARDVTVDLGPLAGVLVKGGEPPRGATIQPGIGHSFLLAEGGGSAIPESILVTWEGQTTAKPVAVPPW